MKKSKITNLNIFGITPETENNIPSQITDLDDGSTIIDSIASLENNKQNNLSFEQLEAVNSGITAGKIMQSPYTTSETNPLVNRDFVNSSIATNTANFIGTFSNIVDLENYSGTLTNNDYAFVTNKVINNGNPFNSFNDMISYVTPVINYVVNYDYAFIVNANDNTKIDVYRYDISKTTIAQRWGENNPVATAIDINDFQKNPAYNRYKYNGSTWEFEYTLNNSSFTASQWAAINSGITAELVSKIGSSTIIGTTDPTTATVGEVGQFYLNTTTNKLFQCQSAGGGSYTWGVPNVNAFTLDSTTQSFENNKQLNIGMGKSIKVGYDNNSTRGFVEIVGHSPNTDFSPKIHLASNYGNSSAREITIQPTTSGDIRLRTQNTNYNMVLPASSGTLALTSDIPSSFTANDVNSEQATQGQVLTADGTGGASWQNASGGKLYQHRLSFNIGNQFIIYSSSNNAMTLSDVAKWLYDNQFIDVNNSFMNSRLPSTSAGDNYFSFSFCCLYSPNGLNVFVGGLKIMTTFDTGTNKIIFSNGLSGTPVSTVTDIITEL